ncbi:hypothetical protein [Paenibacillus medicaginis]|uniref:Uncharacterized protein n=1 Tax=Paenibacillus medicaginis TaxID=1470560 RepID=A0ABV5BXD0_9BACL
MEVQAETELQPFSRRYHNEQACMEALVPSSLSAVYALAMTSNRSASP